MNNLIKYCLNNRLLILFAVILLLLAGVWAMTRAPIDAIPDIGENQIIVWAEWPGRSPQDMEDQVTYPLTTSLMGTPRVKVIRSSSMFGFSLISIAVSVKLYYMNKPMPKRKCL